MRSFGFVLTLAYMRAHTYNTVMPCLDCFDFWPVYFALHRCARCASERIRWSMGRARASETRPHRWFRRKYRATSKSLCVRLHTIDDIFGLYRQTKTRIWFLESGSRDRSAAGTNMYLFRRWAARGERRRRSVNWFPEESPRSRALANCRITNCISNAVQTAIYRRFR